MDNKQKVDEIDDLRERIRDLESRLSASQPLPENSLPPMIIDLGNEKAKNIKALKRGEGKLMNEVSDAIWEVKNQLPESQKDSLLLPVVMIYRKRSKYGKNFFSI